MKFLKKIGVSFLYIIISILISTFIITLLSYINIIGDKLVSIFNVLISIISLFIGGFYIGKNSNNKGYLEGLKLGSIFSIFLLIFNFLALDNPFKVKHFLFYSILIISCVLGSMIGINKKQV